MNMGATTEVPGNPALDTMMSLTAPPPDAEVLAEGGGHGLVPMVAEASTREPHLVFLVAGLAVLCATGILAAGLGVALTRTPSVAIPDLRTASTVNPAVVTDVYATQVARIAFDLLHNFTPVSFDPKFRRLAQLLSEDCLQQAGTEFRTRKKTIAALDVSSIARLEDLRVVPHGEGAWEFTWIATRREFYGTLTQTDTRFKQTLIAVTRTPGPDTPYALAITYLSPAETLAPADRATSTPAPTKAP